LSMTRGDVFRLEPLVLGSALIVVGISKPSIILRNGKWSRDRGRVISSPLNTCGAILTCVT
jgi:hypothetical protein